jgi:hypothetical protein
VSAAVACGCMGVHVLSRVISLASPARTSHAMCIKHGNRSQFQVKCLDAATV